MHDPPKQPPPQGAFIPLPPPRQLPPPWGAFVAYPPGAVVSYAGTIWRCEAAHTSGEAPDGWPTANLDLWTPIGTVTSPNAQQTPTQQTPTQQTPTQQTSYGGPPPYDVTSANPSSYSFNAFSPSSETIKHTPIPVHPPGRPLSDEVVWVEDACNRAMEDDAARARWQLRYTTMLEEESKARNKDELEHELKGERIWRVGGLGVWAYSEDQRVEYAKQEAWKAWTRTHGKDDWLRLARQRTEFYMQDIKGDSKGDSNGGSKGGSKDSKPPLFSWWKSAAADSKSIKPLFTWKLVEKGQRLPIDALPIGNEQDGAVLYAARAWWEGGVHLGKAGHHIFGGASISYAGDELTTDTYEVLCGPINDSYLVKWMTFPHGQRVSVQGWQPVEGGREADGTYILLAKGEFENGQHPGKCLINDDHACIGWGGGELWVRPFQVLAYSGYR